jgi:Zn-dependent protease
LDFAAPKIIDFAIQLAVILFAISFHESAHALAALMQGDTTARDLGRISLNPLRHIDPFGSVILPILLYVTSGLIFGYAKPTPVDLRRTRNPRLADFIVSAAGPVSNFLLAAVGIVALFVLSRVRVDPNVGSTILLPLSRVAEAFLWVNLSLALFNLIPIPPLDGSGVLASILGGSARQAFNRLAPFGFLILILLSSTGILSRILGPVFLFVHQLVTGLLA